MAFKKPLGQKLTSVAFMKVNYFNVSVFTVDVLEFLLNVHRLMFSFIVCYVMSIRPVPCWKTLKLMSPFMNHWNQKDYKKYSQIENINLTNITFSVCLFLTKTIIRAQTSQDE